MTSLNLYLDELDTSLALGTAGTFIGKNFATIGSIDQTLYFQTPLANWRSIFLFKTDGQDDVTGEDVALSTAQGLNLIGTSDASSNSSDTAGLYTPSATLKSVGDNYTDYVINDSSTANGDTTDPACNIDFQSELSRAIFGTPLGIDMLTNEAELATDYGTTIESMATTVNNSFATAGDSTMLSGINDMSVAKLRVCKKLYQQMRFSALSRFTLKYNTALPVGGTFNDGISLAVSRTAGGLVTSTAATADVYMTGTVIDNVVIRDTSNCFLADDKVTISQVGPAFRDYKASDSTTIGAALDDDSATSANHPGGGFAWNVSGAHQVTLLRNTTVTAYPTVDPPPGSVEYWNGDRTYDATGDMSGGNWVDGADYALLIKEDGSMNVYTNGGPTVSEEFTQWTITGWKQTVLRGTLSKAEVTVDGATVVETTLHVKDREYRKFDADICANVQESFTVGNMYTEISAYKFTGTLGVGTALTVVIDTSPAGPVGVQLGTANQTMDIAKINSVQQAILNGTLASDTQLPIETGDVFNLVMKVSNNAAQVNVAGKVLNTIGETVTRSAGLKIKMSA
jgi:hypothetical protein